MKMKVSDEMCAWVQARQKQQADYAKYAAISYVESDEPRHKAQYEQHVAINKELDEVWRMLCQGLHALEAKIPGAGDKFTEEEKK